MAAAAKPKPKSSLPLILGAGALLAVVLVMTGGDSTPPSASSPKKTKKGAKNEDLFTPADYSARFAVFNAAPADVFKPLIAKIVLNPPIKPDGPTGGIPTNLTGGEANWYYTGNVQLNGDNEALLENTTSGESAYVKPGEGWRAAHVQSIDVSAVVLVGSDGNAVSVPLQQYGETPGQRTPVVKDAPLAVPAGALTGAIGAGAPTNGPQRITLSNGQTLDLAAATPDSSANDNAGNRRRRNRRNRNNNDSGDPNNVP